MVRKTLHNLVILTLSVFIHFVCYAQDKEDNNKEIPSVTDQSSIYNAQAKNYRKTDFAKSILYAKKALDDAETHNNVNEQIKAYMNMGDVAYFQSNIPESQIHYSSALELCKQTVNDTLKADVLSNIGSNYIHFGDLETAKVYYQDALLLYEKAEDINGIGNTYNNLGIINLYNNELQEAENNFTKSIELKKEIDNQKDVALALNNIGVLNKDLNNPEGALTYFEEAEIIYNELEDHNGMAEVNNNIGLIHFSLGNNNTALNYFKKALKHVKNTNNKKLLCEVGINCGAVYENQARYEKAINQYHESLEIAEKIDNQSLLAHSCNNIANIYMKMDNYSKSLEYLLKSEELFTAIGDQEGIALCYIGLGNIYSNMGLNEKAIEYYKLSMVVNESLGKSERLAEIHQNIGALYEFNNDLDLAKEHYEASLNINKELGFEDKIAKNLMTLGSIYKIEKKYDKAEVFYKKSYNIARQLGQKEILVQYFKNMSEIYYERNDYKTAIEFLFDHNSTKDSIINKDINKQITEIMTKYESEKKEQEIEKLNIEKELSKTKIKQQYFIIYGFIGIFVLIVFVLFLIIRQFQQKKAANKLLRSQNDIITVQKKEITDSINYARHIQTAILPSELTIKKYLPDSFVLYKPRDIVSGDFYWITEKANRIIYTAADSTGHGVPGAFMSIIGSLLLDITVEEITSMNAADILSNLKNRLVSTLNRDGDKVVQDGMDMALIVLDKSEEKLVIDYAGANNPLYIINKGELQEIKPTKMPVGFYNGDKNRTFINNRLNLQKSDLLYIFSDGYADQFGGPNGKKFKYKQLKNLLLEIHHLNLQEQKLILDQKFEDWKGEHEQVDDVIVMGIRV